MKRLDILLDKCCLLGLHDKSKWEAGARLYVTRQGSFELRSKVWPGARNAGLTETCEAVKDVQGRCDHSTSLQKSKWDV